MRSPSARLAALALLGVAGSGSDVRAATPSARSGAAGERAEVAWLPPLPAWRALFEAARRRHPLWGERAFPSAPEAAPRPAAGGVAPLIAPPGLVREALDDGSGAVDEARLAAAVLASRKASLVYRGLAGLDEATLGALSANPGLVKRVGDCCADAFAAFGGRLRTSGVPLETPAGALPDLLREHEGRRALLRAIVARLDGPHVRFAIGPDGPGREAALRALASAVDLEPVWWGRGARGFGRDEADTERALSVVRVDADGCPLPPRTIAFWQAVYSGGAAPSASTWIGRVAASGPIDASWLLGAVGGGGGTASVRETRLAQLAFGQRVFVAPRDEDLVETVTAVQALADRPALVLSLERMGVREPALYAAVVSVARSARDMLLLQAGLAVIERARFARSVGAADAAALVRSLVAVPWSNEAALGAAVGTWVRSTLLPALGGSAPAPGDAEETVLRAMAGPRHGVCLPVVDWEGSRYRVEPTAAELERLHRVRERQGGDGLDAALARCVSSPSDCAGVLRTTLTSIVYAAHLGDPDGPALAGQDPSRRHDLGVRPWALPEEGRDAGGVWRVRGSLLGLDQALALLSLRRPEGDGLPEVPPLFGPDLRRGLAAAAALLNPVDLTGEQRDGIALAIARGRARVEALGEGSDTRPVAEAAGLEPWRASALRWLLDHDREARRTFFSLTELLALGGGDGSALSAWGGADPLTGGLATVPLRPRPRDESDGRAPERALGRGFAELNLRVAVFLSERGLPASLAPALVKRLLPALVDESRPVAADDRLALEDGVRRIADATIEDAVASLAGDGPLRPLREGER